MIKYIILLIIGLITLTIGYSFWRHYGTYVNDYHAYIGIRDLARFDLVIETFGEPLSIDSITDARADVVFDGITFIFNHGQGGLSYLETHGMVVGIMITDPDIRFGRMRIGVGSTRFNIRFAYWLLYRTWFWQNDERLEVVDGDTWLKFDFDENNRVRIITFGLHGP